MKNILDVRRKADREKMATHVTALALACGSTCVRRSDPESWKPRAVMLDIAAPGGLIVTVSFDGDSGQPTTHFLHWTVDRASQNKLRPSFGAVNPHHFCKATGVANSFEAFCDQLQRGLELAATGEAYQVVTRPAAAVAA